MCIHAARKIINLAQEFERNQISVNVAAGTVGYNVTLATMILVADGRHDRQASKPLPHLSYIEASLRILEDQATSFADARGIHKWFKDLLEEPSADVAVSEDAMIEGGLHGVGASSYREPVVQDSQGAPVVPDSIELFPWDLDWPFTFTSTEFWEGEQELDNMFFSETVGI